MVNALPISSPSAARYVRTFPSCQTETPPLPGYPSQTRPRESAIMVTAVFLPPPGNSDTRDQTPPANRKLPARKLETHNEWLPSTTIDCTTAFAGTTADRSTGYSRHTP